MYLSMAEKNSGQYIWYIFVNSLLNIWADCKSDRLQHNSINTVITLRGVMIEILTGVSDIHFSFNYQRGTSDWVTRRLCVKLIQTVQTHLVYYRVNYSFVYSLNARMISLTDYASTYRLINIDWAIWSNHFADKFAWLENFSQISKHFLVNKMPFGASGPSPENNPGFHACYRYPLNQSNNTGFHACYSYSYSYQSDNTQPFCSLILNLF